MIKNAFQCFDEDNSGTISEDVLREQLTTKGDRYTHEQVLLTFTFFKCVAMAVCEIQGTLIKFSPIWQLAPSEIAKN